MTPGAENAQPIELPPGYGYNMLVIINGVISGVINKMSPIIAGNFAIMMLLSQVPPTLAQSTENEDDTPTLAHILVALVTAVICFFIANKITCKIDNYLTNSESDEESDEEDSSNEEDNSDEGNSGIDIPTGDSTPVVPLSTIVKFKEGTTLEEYFVSIGFTAKTFEIRHLLLRAKEIVQEVSHLDQLNLITPSPALHRFLLTAEPTYDGDKLTHSDICSVLSKYVLQNYHSIKTERTKILKLSQHNPLYRLFRVNFIHRCQIQSFLSTQLHPDSKPTMTLDIQNSKNIKITVTKVHDNKPATDGVKSIPGSTLILQLQEELRCNQKKSRNIHCRKP